MNVRSASGRWRSVKRAVQRRELRAQALETLAQRGPARRAGRCVELRKRRGVQRKHRPTRKRPFRAAVKRGVDERMKGVPPKSGTGETGKRAAVANARGGRAEKVASRHSAGRATGAEPREPHPRDGRSRVTASGGWEWDPPESERQPSRLPAQRGPLAEWNARTPTPRTAEAA